MLVQVNTVFQVAVVFFALTGCAYPDVLNAQLIEALWYVTVTLSTCCCLWRERWTTGATTFASGLSYIISPDAVKILSIKPSKNGAESI